MTYLNEISTGLSTAAGAPQRQRAEVNVSDKAGVGLECLGAFKSEIG